MFTQFGATADSLSKASTMVFRIGTDAHLYDDPDDVSIAPLLDSKFDSEKCEALKRLLALIAQGFDVSNFFPQVVKNVASQSLEVKKLVYLYLLHYAEKRPNEALLSINCFQKDLGDPNPLVRAWALRTMAGIRLHAIAPIVLMAVGKCARDPSVYVRKCAANALPKLHDLRLEEHTAAIEEIVGILLNDSSPGVVGAAAAAFSFICPNNLSLIGRSYRRLCESLPDVEEWGQIILIGILLRYAIAKHGIAQESIMLFSHSLMNSGKEGLDPGHVFDENSNGFSGDLCPEMANRVFQSYFEGSDKFLSHSNHTDMGSSGLDGSCVSSAKFNDDVKILLQCTSPLLWSHNSAVVLAAAGVHWIMAPKEDIKKIVKPLLFLLRSSNASKYVVLCNIQIFAKVMPSLFVEYFEDFFVNSWDTAQIKSLKLDILSSIATNSSISSIFLEFQDYVRDSDRRFAADTVAAIGLCAQQIPELAHTCLEGLLALTLSESTVCDAASADGDAFVLVEAIKSIKAIIRQDPPKHSEVIVHLVRCLDSIRAPSARAMIIWMVGEYNTVGVIPKVLPLLFKYLAQHFTLEAVETKLQILNTCAKVVLSGNGEDISILKTIVGYVLDLAKCDLNYDVRDRSRLLKKILSCCAGFHDLEELKGQAELEDLKSFLIKHMFGGETKSPLSESSSYRFYLPGSLSQIVLHSAPGYEPLPEPCSLICHESDYSADIGGMKTTGTEEPYGNSNKNDDSDATSGSLDEGSVSSYDSQDSATDSSVSGGSYASGSVRVIDKDADQLIQLSDVDAASRYQSGGAEESNASACNDLGELMSRRAFESWLDENPSSHHQSSSQSHVRTSLARISIKDIRNKVKPKSYVLLDPANGNGLSVEYRFLSDVSSISPLLVCLQVSFKNCSTGPFSNILISEEGSMRSPDSANNVLSMRESSMMSPSDVPTLVPMEEIVDLEPGQTTERILQVRFNHHLLPLKLILSFKGGKHHVKLRPDIGYFVRPLPMDIDAFSNKESQLPGMFEHIRSCTFSDHLSECKDDENSLVTDKFLMICEKLALKMLSNVNLSLISVEMPVAATLDDITGLHLRFSGEISSNSVPCLITLTLQGTCSQPITVSVKINCEETVFGLNLLNRIIYYLAEPNL